MKPDTAVKNEDYEKHKKHENVWYNVNLLRESNIQSYKCMCIYVCMCVYMCICVRIHIHTYGLKSWKHIEKYR